MVLQGVLTQAWTQVTIVWTTEKVTIFTNGQGRWEGQVASACPIPAQSKMRITVGTDVCELLRYLYQNFLLAFLTLMRTLSWV